MFLNSLKDVPAVDPDGQVNVFVETPKSSRYKYDLDPSGLFRISLELPEGMRFPFSFGFVPNTKAEDGDALDIVLMTDGTMPHGALIDARLVGVLKMENDEGGEMVRNDRVVAIANISRVYEGIATLDDTREGFSWDLEIFFEAYNRMIERPFRNVGRGGREEAQTMLHDAMERADSA